MAIRRAAKIGDNYFISTTASIATVGQLIETYRRFRVEFDKPFEGVYLNRIVCVTRNAKQKAEAEEFYARALLKLYDSWGHENVTSMDETERSVEHISGANLIVGEPEECIDRFQEYLALGVGHIACLTNFGFPPAEWMGQSIRLMGEKVIPRF